MKAVLDLGTNTFHLLIAEVQSGEIIELYQQQIPVMMGAGGINKGFITPQAYQRGLQALADFYTIIQKFDVGKVIATGTSAIRNASNGGDFLTEVKTRFGFDVQQISGDTEATLIYKGVAKSFPFPAEPIVVMDIGGGSVELIIGLQDTILWKQSFEVGATRLVEKFNPQNPISQDQIVEIETYLYQSFKPFAEALVQTRATYKNCKLLVGSAGSFETLLDVLQMDLKSKNEAISNFAKTVNHEQADIFYKYILASTQEAREKMLGLLPFRVNMIVVAVLLMRHIHKNYGLNQIIVSHYALKEGLLLEN